MTFLCATALLTQTWRRPLGLFCLSRLPPTNSDVICGTATPARELPSLQSLPTPWRKVMYGRYLSPPALCRMTGANMWCTKFWQRDPCPTGWFPCFRTCHTQSILWNWDSTTTLIWAGTQTEVTAVSTSLCWGVSGLSLSLETLFGLRIQWLIEIRCLIKLVCVTDEFQLQETKERLTKFPPVFTLQTWRIWPKKSWNLIASWTCLRAALKRTKRRWSNAPLQLQLCLWRMWKRNRLSNDSCRDCKPKISLLLLTKTTLVTLTWH